MLQLPPTLRVPEKLQQLICSVAVRFDT